MNPSRPCLSKMKKNKLFSITRNTKMTRFLTKLGCQNQPQDTSSHLRARTYRSPPGRTESPAARTEGFLDVQIAPLDVQRASWTYRAPPDVQRASWTYRRPHWTCRGPLDVLDVQRAPLDVQRTIFLDVQRAPLDVQRPIRAIFHLKNQKSLNP